MNELDEERVARGEPLAWPVKLSFRRYVQASGGTITVTPPVQEEGTFYTFPRSTGTYPEGEVRYLGDIYFEAHFGALKVLLADPGIVFADGRASLTVVDNDHLPDRSQRAAIAWLAELEGAVPAPGRREFWPHLTEYGARLFGDVYAPDTTLDPISFVPEWRA